MNVDFKGISGERLDKIKILAFDLDDTLLDESSRISQRSGKALDEACRRGYHCVVATGRGSSTLPKDVLEQPSLRYVITSNGARTQDIKEGKLLFTSFISEEALSRLIPWLADETVMKEVFCGGKVYTGYRCLNNLSRFGLKRPEHVDYVLRTRTGVEDIMRVMEENSAVLENINLIFSEPEKRLRYLDGLQAVEGITAVSSMPFNIEIGGDKTSKAYALDELAGMLGLGLENVMAFGDSSNDEDMIRRAGIGVAMGNGLPRVKEAADMVAPPSNEDGVARVLESLLGR